MKQQLYACQAWILHIHQNILPLQLKLLGSFHHRLIQLNHHPLLRPFNPLVHLSQFQNRSRQLPTRRSFTSTQIHILHSPILPHHKPLSPTSSSSSKELILDLDPVGFFDFKLPAAVYFFAATGPIKKQRLSEKHQDKGEGEAHAQESKEKGPNCKYV
ncbi:hypothetical protein F2Q69_00020460 [Brassica cretica]|uniref:Uncharacterized protein n=1 Tax=Brassica cretica TaxID=69181 RepID=A0A8S9QBM3_BRACR|nr:hypothetical protein F2Q69_00020460 [Brassica cretica]